MPGLEVSKRSSERAVQKLNVPKGLGLLFGHPGLSPQNALRAIIVPTSTDCDNSRFHQVQHAKNHSRSLPIIYFFSTFIQNIFISPSFKTLRLKYIILPSSVVSS